MNRVVLCCLLCLALSPASRAEPGSMTRFGSDPRLAEGAMALGLHQYAEAERLTRAGLAAELSVRDRAAALSNLCAALTGQARYAEALEACDASVALRPGSFRVFNNRALVHLGAGRLAAARADLDAGLALNPDAATLARVAALIDAAYASGRVLVADR